jgi:yecA family protein
MKVSSLARKYRNGAIHRVDQGVLMPPDMRTFGAVPFGDQQRTRLVTWLREGGWPREHMDIATLEGYLIALLVWPVGISAGAWLPPIWGQRGWRVPAKIAARSQFDEFVALIIGFMRDLDGRLSHPQSTLEFSVLRESKDGALVRAFHAWGQGFMAALSLGAPELKWRTAGTQATVQIIANITSGATPLGINSTDEIARAVRALMEQRTTRGPLGPLEPVPA